MRGTMTFQVCRVSIIAGVMLPNVLLWTSETISILRNISDFVSSMAEAQDMVLLGFSS